MAKKTPRQVVLEHQHAAAAQRQGNINATLAAGNSPFQPFKPYQPPDPAGYYDPALNAQQGAANRGYGDTQDDISLAGTRAGADYGLQLGQLQTQEGNENYDYKRNTDLLARATAQLGRQQGEKARQYGVTSGGIALLSAAKRQDNQRLQQQSLDTAHSRSITGLDDQIGLLGVNYNRGITDRTTTLSRAGRENTQFGVDTTKEKAYQADQAGYIAPAAPKGQLGGVISSGVPRRTATVGGYTYTYDATGKILGKKRIK